MENTDPIQPKGAVCVVPAHPSMPALLHLQLFSCPQVPIGWHTVSFNFFYVKSHKISKNYTFSTFQTIMGLHKIVTIPFIDVQRMEHWELPSNLILQSGQKQHQAIIHLINNNFCDHFFIIIQKTKHYIIPLKKYLKYSNYNKEKINASIFWHIFTDWFIIC